MQICRKSKEMNLKLPMTPMVGVKKLNLVSIDQMTHKQIVVVVRMEPFQRNHVEAKNQWASSKTQF